ncbi:DUF502 domain-containing protein [Hyphobacterium sp. HN65]|uniref:DUF502 domain-containing protein n=1 Tax=Hyphobacterium lacteum TaxID=3116575 RepID=A0ABU7LM37_9PROT|nr:DUF502 domain-containing protein [Hyphobacterium sp. HN65]MEE2524981.1 DUF502 domain-containing protein [Hyphobacterium sp. HN65]
MFRWLRNSLLTGIVVALPVTVTVWLIYTFVNFVDRVIKPLIPEQYNPETYLPFALPGLGVVVAVVGLTLLGALAANFFGRSLIGIGERLLNSVPLVRNVYGAVKQIAETVFSSRQQSFQEVVLVEFPTKGSYAVGFVTADARGEIQDDVSEDAIGVFVPTTPNPTSGFLLYTPRSRVMPLSMSVEEAAKMIISFGLVTPEGLARADMPDEVKKAIKKSEKPD